MSWPLVSIKDVAKVVTGKTPSKSEDDNFGGEIPFVTPAELDGSVYVSTSSQTITKKGAENLKLVPKNAVMVCCIGSLGKLAIADREVATNQQINSVIFDEEKVYPKYGYYSLSRLKPIMENMAPSTTVAILNKSKFESLEIPSPPLLEQKRIAAILDKADAIRRKRQQAIQLADEFLRAVFLDMFGDPVANPKGWKSIELGSCLEFLTSGSRGWAKYYSEEGESFIRIQNVGKNRLILDDMACVNAPEGAEAKRTKVQLGDILLSITADLGRAAVVTEDLVGGYINQHLALLRVNKAEFDPTFVAALLSSDAGVRQFRMKNKSAVKAGLNFDDIRTLQLIHPSLDMQTKFSSICIKLRCFESRMSYSLNELTREFDALSQKAFRGDL